MKEIKRFWGCFGIGLGVLIGALDWSIVQNALPAIQQSLGASIGELQWIMNAFGLFMVSLLVTMGRLGDVFGRRRLFDWGLFIFAASSLGAALSPSPFWLIVARAIQGIGFAIIMPTTQALLSHAFPKELHGKAMGVWATLAGVGLVFGPVLGGLIVSFLSWHWVFYINIPVAIFSYILVRTFVDESKNEDSPPHIDVKGIIVFILALGLCIFGIIQAPEWGWTSPAILVSLALSVIFFVVFYFTERDSKSPLIQFSFFKNRQFCAASLSIFAGCFLFWSSFFLLPLYLQNYRNESPWVSGAVLLSVGIPFTVLSQMAGSAADRVDKRKLLVGGLFLVSISAFSFTLIDASVSLYVICLILIIFGVGQALHWAPATSLGISSLPRNQAGVASGAITTIQETGGSIGLALAGTMFRVAEKHHFNGIASSKQIDISPEVMTKVKSLLSDFGKLHEFLNAQVPALSTKLIEVFKNSFLSGFHAGMTLAAAVAFICMASIFLFAKTFKVKKEAYRLS